MTNPVLMQPVDQFSGLVTRSDGLGGLSAAGRSSTDPATARKAEEKKRGQGARIVAQGDAPACNLLRNHDARVLHGSVYNRGTKNWQSLRLFFRRLHKT